VRDLAAAWTIFLLRTSLAIVEATGASTGHFQRAIGGRMGHVGEFARGAFRGTREKTKRWSRFSFDLWGQSGGEQRGWRSVNVADLIQMPCVTAHLK